MIYTIGTNGKKFPEFIEIIKSIDTVLDVRYSARSHYVKKFSDKSLSVELPEMGIKYIHKPGFGVPSNIVKSYTKLKPIFDKHEEKR